MGSDKQIARKHRLNIQTMTRKKLSPINEATVYTPDYPAIPTNLPTMYEESAYDWIEKRKELSAIYSQTENFHLRRNFYNQHLNTEHYMEPYYNYMQEMESREIGQKFHEQRRHANPSKKTSKTVDNNQNVQKLTRRNSTKQTVDKKKMKKETKEKKEMPKEFSVSNLYTHKKADIDPSEELSMWSCRKCTLDNPLQEKICAACGGSRLCSIGDIDIPSMFQCTEVVEMIEEVEKKEKHEDKETLKIEKENKYVDLDIQFRANKRLSKIEDDENDYKIVELPQPKTIIITIIYIILFIFVFNW